MNIAIIQSDDRQIAHNIISKELNYDESNDSVEMIYGLNENKISNSWNYWEITYSINKLKVNKLGHNYKYYFFNLIRERDFPNYHPSWSKVSVISKFMKENKNIDLIVYLDSDAWIRDHYALDKLLTYFYSRPEKQGMFSRDPKLAKNTFINAGVQIWKNNLYSFEVLKNASEFLKNLPAGRKGWWPYEQRPISDFVKENISDFLICKVNILNTPCGKIIRHCWNKSLIKELLIDESLSCLLLEESKPINFEINHIFE